MSASCKTCRCYQQRVDGDVCRYNPPVIPPASPKSLGVFPVVRHDDWCRKYEPHETL